MKTLHLTNHSGTRTNIENVFEHLNMKNNIVSKNFDLSSHYISKSAADEIWKNSKNDILEEAYKCLIFTDTSMMARPFLQNINEHKCFVIVYITNRFNWGLFHRNDQEYIDLYSELSSHERVVFCSDNSYDQYYAEFHNIKFLYDAPISLTPKLSDLINQYTPDTSNNLESCNKYFITNRGTNVEKYKEILENLTIEYDIFSYGYKRYRDSLHLCEYKGIIHFPYQVNVQSLWENLGYYIIYFIPSKRFIKELIYSEPWYYWEEKDRPDHLEKSIEVAEWYKEEHEPLFEYFDNWSELEYKTKNLTHEDLLKKKEIIKSFMEESNKNNLLKWQNIFSKIT